MSRRRTIVQLLVSIAVGILVVGVLVRLFEKSLIFYPTPHPDGIWDPAALGIEVHDLWFESAAGPRLHAWWVPATTSNRPGEIRETVVPRAPREGASPPGPDPVPSPGAAEQRRRRGAEPPSDSGRDDAVHGLLRDRPGRPLLLWMHGNAGNLTYRLEHAAVLAANGLDVLLFDYQGYGRSDGSPSEDGLYADAEGAYRFLTERLAVSPRQIVLYGRSLGAAPAARLASRHEHAGLVLVSPFPSAASMARRMFFGLPMHWFGRARFPVAEWVGHRSTPLLVIHGEADGIVPLSLGRRVFEGAAEPKRFVALPGTGHNDVLARGGRRYLEALVSFAFAVVDGSPPR